MNPMIIIQQLMQSPMMNNPTMQNAMGMMKNNNVQGLQQLAENLCKQKGVSLSDIQQQVRQRFGM